MNLTIEKVASVSSLEAAWSRVKKKGSAGGVDGVTVASFEKDAQENIRQLSGDMLSGRYVPEPLQRIGYHKGDWPCAGFLESKKLLDFSN